MDADVPEPPSTALNPTAVVDYYAEAFSACDEIGELLEIPSTQATNNQTRFRLYKTMAFARGYVSTLFLYCFMLY